MELQFSILARTIANNNMASSETMDGVLQEIGPTETNHEGRPALVERNFKGRWKTVITMQLNSLYLPLMRGLGRPEIVSEGFILQAMQN